MSSVLVKLIDWVIILLEEDVIKLNELQFAYQRGCSTVMCTWAAVETIDYYLKNGSEVFTCATDMSKAFDLTLHRLMFKKNAQYRNESNFCEVAYIYIYKPDCQCTLEWRSV